MDIFGKVVSAIAEEMELPEDGSSILEKAVGNPGDFGHLAGALGVSADAVSSALTDGQTVEGFAAALGVDAAAAGKALWLGARFREDMEADSLDLVGLIMALESLSEEEFGVALEIPDEDAQKISSMGEAMAYLQKTLGEAGVDA